MSWSGGTFGDTGTCVLAPNADVMTLDGTNTWVLRDPDSSRSVVVDPGPSIDAHLDAIDAAAGDVAVVLLTHHHADHSEAAREYAERHGCGVRALDPAYRLGLGGPRRGRRRRRRRAGGARRRDPRPHVGLAVLRRAAGPGRADRRHGAGSRHDRRRAPRRPARGLPLLAPAAPRALRGAGDHHGVARPRPGDRRRARRPRLLPRPPAAAARARCAHALRDLHAVEREGGSFPHETLPRAIVEVVYADVDPVLWGAAELSVRAQLAYLTQE